MGRKTTNDELIKHKDEALCDLSNYIDTLISSNKPHLNSKADKLCYWLKDYTKFLSYEPEFKSTSLRRYKRGEIIKVHLGYNIGSEEGGLHYCVVLDKKNSIHSPVISIVPLKSLKPETDINKLRNGEIYLGNELFTNLNSKVATCNKNVKDELHCLLIKLNRIKDEDEDETFIKEIKEVESRIEKVEEDKKLLARMRAEVFKMKRGSIALTNQITTISKMRIYDPKTNNDVLSNIRLSNEKLDAIDFQIIKNYTNIKNE